MVSVGTVLNISVYSLMIVIVLFAAYVLATRKTGLRMLICKLKGKSLLILCSDDGILNFIPVSKPDINTLKKDGTWVFDKKSSYVYAGIPAYFGYIKGPAVTAPIEAHVAASKLKSLFTIPEMSLKETIFKAEQAELKTNFMALVRASRTREEWSNVRQIYKGEKEARTQALHEIYEIILAQSPDSEEETAKKLAEYSNISYDSPFEYETVDAFVAANMAGFPADEIEYYVSYMPDEEYAEMIEKARDLCQITPVDITALTDYSNALNPHTIQAKINRSVNERISGFGFAQKVSGTQIAGFITFFVIVAIILYMFYTGNGGSAVDTIAGAAENMTVIGV